MQRTTLSLPREAGVPLPETRTDPVPDVGPSRARVLVTITATLAGAGFAFLCVQAIASFFDLQQRPFWPLFVAAGAGAGATLGLLLFRYWGGGFWSLAWRAASAGAAGALLGAYL